LSRLYTDQIHLDILLFVGFDPMGLMQLDQLYRSGSLLHLRRHHSEDLKHDIENYIPYQ